MRCSGEWEPTTAGGFATRPPAQPVVSEESGESAHTWNLMREK